jgi:hypothetical protein
LPDRPAIPADITREILIESGHRCAVCGAGCPLERAHIIPWHKSREHKAEDLICLCASCHERADLEDWGEKTLREYKQNPWVLRQYKSEEAINTKSKIEITLAIELSDFDERNQRLFQYAIAAFLNVAPGNVRIISVEESNSIKVILEVPSESAEKLVEAARRGDPELKAYFHPFGLLSMGRVSEIREGQGESMKDIEPAGRLETPSGSELAESGQKSEVIEGSPKGVVAEPPKTKLDVWGRIPHWFIPTVGLIYATGFLINITFLDRFGLRESSGEFFKVKYLHAGILFWLLPTIVLAPIYGFYLVWRFGKDAINKDQPIFKVYVPSAVLVTNLLFVFYVFAVFTPPGTATRREFVIPAMFIFTVVGIIATRFGTGKLIEKGLAQNFGEKLNVIARWILCVGVVIGLDWYALDGFLRTLWDIFWDGGIYFFLFLLTAAFMIERVRVRGNQYADVRMKLTLQVLGGCLIIAAYYLSVLAFTIRIYPYIPVTKGGGDYVGAPNVILCFQGNNEKLAVPALIGSNTSNDCIPSKEFQIIEESATSIFVADPNDAGGPKSWRVGPAKPIVYEVRRDKVGSITFINHP